MTVYYIPECLIEGGPPFDKCPDYQGDIVNDSQDEGCLGPTIAFYQDEWYILRVEVNNDGFANITTTAKVLAKYPANQYHRVGQYISEYAMAMYNWQCRQIRPEQDPVDQSMGRHPAGKKRV